ncbi:MAG: DUF1592 domain-containing protein [Deltaproteobacteria bacterium]|nr:DUF1592 domain-containing protein [Deltaproteobacteria bacterium]
MIARACLVVVALGLGVACDEDRSGAPPTTGPTGGSDAIADTSLEVPLVDGPAGTVVFRRLNRTEWKNTMRDLLSLPDTLADGLAADLPSDDLGYGFDNVASVLSLSPLHLELYERAAQRLATLATTRPIVEPLAFETDGATASSSAEYFGARGGFGVMYSPGEVSAAVILPRAGTWRFEARVFEDAAGPDHALLHLMVDGRDVLVEAVAATEAAPTVLSVDLPLEAGRHALAVGWYNDFYDPPADRNVGVDWLRLVGPAELDTLEDTVWSRVVRCDLAAADAGDVDCARESVRALATRAFRRPVGDAELASLMGLFEAARATEADGAVTPWTEALALPIQAILMAPQTIFKVELQDDPASPMAEPLDGYELATRLSYFLWSTLPDEALIEAAAQGRLATADGVAVEVRRMLADPRAWALVDNFAGQWLYIRDIDNVFPDQGVFPEFDEGLRHAMAEEMRLFFASFVFPGERGERSLVELLTATDSWVDARLAEHYGLEVPDLGEGDGFVPVSLDGVERRGLLTQAGLLTALSTPFRTSIVRRGKWVLSQLLCSTPSPPPPGVEGLIEAEQSGAPRTLREKMELHKTEERCVTCHKSMDAIGFALERYDGIGQVRETDNGFPIDTTGELRGQAFDGALELADILAADPRLPACVVEKLFVYALGRGVTSADEGTLARIGRDLAARGYRFTALVELVATSDAFRFRQGVASP